MTSPQNSLPTQSHAGSPEASGAARPGAKRSHPVSRRAAVTAAGAGGLTLLFGTTSAHAAGSKPDWPRWWPWLSSPEPSDPAPSEDSPSDTAPPENAPADPAAPDTGPITVEGLEAEIHRQINAERAAAGLSGLTRNATIDAYARSWSQTMARENSLRHGANFASNFPAGWRAAGENVAMGSARSTNEQMANTFVTGWMNSAGHRANILNGRFNTTGIGAGRASNGSWYATQNFAQY